MLYHIDCDMEDYYILAYDVVDAAGEVVAQGSYWVELDLPR